MTASAAGWTAAGTRDLVGPAFQGVETAWKNAGREGRPRLVAIAYFALGDIDKGRGNVWDHYISAGDEVARLITGGVLAGPMRVKTGLKEFAEIGADEVILNPTLDDLDEIERLAEVVLLRARLTGIMDGFAS